MFFRISHPCPPCPPCLLTPQAAEWNSVLQCPLSSASLAASRVARAKRGLVSVVITAPPLLPLPSRTRPPPFVPSERPSTRTRCRKATAAVNHQASTVSITVSTNRIPRYQPPIDQPPSWETLDGHGPLHITASGPLTRPADPLPPFPTRLVSTATELSTPLMGRPSFPIAYSHATAPSLFSLACFLRWYYSSTFLDGTTPVPPSVVLLECLLRWYYSSTSIGGITRVPSWVVLPEYLLWWRSVLSSALLELQ